MLKLEMTQDKFDSYLAILRRAARTGVEDTVPEPDRCDSWTIRQYVRKHGISSWTSGSFHATWLRRLQWASLRCASLS